MTSDTRQSFGHSGEEIATNYLQDQGYMIRTRNYRNARGFQLGEIDIIAQKDRWIVFVEVKTRTMSTSTDELPLPEEQITRRKVAKIQKIASWYLTQNHLWDHPWRIDAISIVLTQQTQQIQIRHLESIFF